MRVIETFVKHVPRENIPADAKWFVQGSVSGGLFSITGKDKPVLCGTGWHGIGKTLRHSTQTVATDAAETVVTREELMRAYDLVEQGYTLWFGGECPVECGAIVDVVFRSDKRGEASDVGEFYRWSARGVATDIIAYRLSRSVDKDVNRVTNARDSAALKTRLELLDKMTDGVWPGADDEKFLVTADGKQLIRHNPEKLITRAQWDDYVSRKIRVGDRVLVSKGTVPYKVVFIGEHRAFLRTDSGFESSAKLNLLTRISQ